MTKSIVKTALVSIFCGSLGVMLGLAVNHVYDDHKALHAIIDMINANAAKQNGTPPQVPR